MQKSVTTFCPTCGVSLATPDAECAHCLLGLGFNEEPFNEAKPVAPPGRGRMMFGDYELLEEIARGGMGIVYRARQRGLGRIVALKLILDGQLATRELVHRFRGEAAAAAVLQHPHIVAIHEVGVHDGHHFFSMDYIDGQNFTQLVGNQPLPADQAARYLKKITEAIHYAHEQGILHRDLKPSNVLVEAATDLPRVTDFGLAKRLDGDSSLTMTGQVLGSPHFMPPEQASPQGGKVGRAGDVYALGGILYFLLTARPPFQGDSLEAILSQVFHAEPVSPRLLNAAVPRDLETICLKCLDKDQSRRYATAEAMGDDLGRFLQGEPTLARATTRIERTWRWCRRKPAMAGLLATAVALLLTLAVGSPIAALRIQRARQIAVANAAEALRYVETLRRTSYTADMSLAWQAVEQGDLGQARKLLDRHRPKADQQDLRGFEWRYLWSRSRSHEEAILGKYHGGCGGVAISPDGSLVTSVDRETLVVRSLPNGEVVMTMKFSKAMEHVGGPVVRFSSDGRQLLAEDPGGDIRRWTTRNWREESRLEGLSAPFAFVQQGRALVAWAGDHLAVWDTATWTLQKKIPARTELNVFSGQSLATSPDGDTIFRGGDHGEISSWDLAQDRELERLDTGVGNTIPCLSVSSRGVLAVAHFTGEVTLWDIKTRQRLDLLHDHRSWVSRVAFTPDGSIFVSASADRTMVVYDMLENGSANFRNRLLGHGGEIWAMALSPDARWLCSGCDYDGTLRLWNIDKPLVAPLNTRMRIPLEFTSSGRGLIGWSDTASLLELDIDTGAAAPLAGMPASLKINLGDLVWPSDTYHPLRNRLTARKRAALATPAGLEIWNLQTSEMETSLAEPHINKQSFTFSDDGSQLATASLESGLRLWQTRDWSVRQLMPKLKLSYLMSLCFSPDNTKLAVMNGEQNVLIDLASGGIFMTLETHGSYTMARTFSSDNQYFAAGRGDNRIHLWNILRKEKLPDVLDGHVAGVRGLCFSPNGRTLVSCGDNRVKLWNVETGQEFFTLQQARVETAWPMFSADGTCLVTATAEPSVHLWKAPSWEEIASIEKATPRPVQAPLAELQSH